MRLPRILPALIAVTLVACLGDYEAPPTYPDVSIENTGFASSLNVNLAASTKTASGLYYRDLTVGTGATLTSGKQVGVYYRGSFPDGRQFDARQPPASAFSFSLGAGQVIPGWDEGLQGMKVGGSRQLIIPSRLAYGSTGYGPIPPNTNLVFVVDAVSVQ